jgi:predicted nucleotidyltransferase
VKFEADATLLDQVGLSQSMSDLLGCSVDIISERSLHKKIANFVLKDAIRL